jgi:hypothetical protein
MRSHESILALIAELDGNEREIERVLGLNERAWQRILAGADDPLDWGALGYTIHTLYGLAENYFLRISKFFENGLPSDTWHKALVEKMSLDIPPLRPPLFTEKEQLRDALEILKFRHRFRNLYGEDLDPVKTRAIQAAATRFFSSFPAVHRTFRAKIVAIAEALV